MAEPLKITSAANERLVQFRKVRDGKVRDRVFIEGARLAEEAIVSDLELTEAAFTPSFAATERGKVLLSRLIQHGISLIEISDDLFKKIADTVHSQGIAILARRPDIGREAFEKNVPTGDDLLIYLHETNDPSNLGAVLRTAEAAGVSGVILSEGSADVFSPKALRAGMGANLRTPIWDRAAARDCIEWARKRGIRVIAADINAKSAHTEVDWKVPSLLMFGSEAHGLDDDLLELADDKAFIPMKNGVESLNLAVSAGIILFEAVRQRSV